MGIISVSTSILHNTGLLRILLVVLSCLSFTTVGFSAEPRTIVREGLKLYSQSEFEGAREKFVSATEALDQQKSAAAAIAAFDAACASHRQEDWEKARESYLRAGLSQDRKLATAAHFNLGNLAADQARKLAGEQPETVPAEKRTEILDHLKQAIAAYRHCLELQPDHSQSRRNMELVRLWIKFYSDKWNELDRQKRRDESNLIEFLEFLIQTQTALKTTVEELPAPIHADRMAELKRMQDEIREEIPTLRDKIATDLKPPTEQGTATPPANSKEIQEGIALLQSWADAAAERMGSAASRLSAKETTQAAAEQLAAIEELDRIWDAVIPFHPLLSKELNEQTRIAKDLQPASSASESPSEEPQKSTSKATPTTTSPESKASEPASEPASEATPTIEPDTAEDTKVTPESKSKSDSPATPSNKESEKTEGVPIKPADLLNESPHKLSGAGTPSSRQLVENKEADDSILKAQEQTLKKSRLLAPKAQAELERFEKQPSPRAGPMQTPKVGSPAVQKSNPETEAPKQPDPEQVKAGYRKAVELAPKAVEQMEAAIQALHRKDRSTAALKAEEARKTLEEIQQAQPRNEDQQKQDQQQDQQKKDQQDQKDQQSQDDQKQKSDQSKDKRSEDQQKDQKEQEQKEKDKQEKDQEQKDQQKQDQQKDQQSQQLPRQQPGQLSPDRIEEALRKVRERQQAKRERDRKLKVQVFGRVPVDKDW